MGQYHLFKFKVQVFKSQESLSTLKTFKNCDLSKGLEL